MYVCLCVCVAVSRSILAVRNQVTLTVYLHLHRHTNRTRRPPSSPVTFTLITNHKTPRETNQISWREASRPIRRLTKKSTSRLTRRQQTGRCSNHCDPGKLDAMVHISPPHSSWHCFISAGLWRTQLSEADGPGYTDSVQPLRHNLGVCCLVWRESLNEPLRSKNINMRRCFLDNSWSLSEAKKETF